MPALHSVEQSLGASREWSAWLITVYLIVATIATPAMGRLADLHGRRRMLLIGLGVFTAGSVGAAFAPEQKARDPLIDLHALRTPAVLRANLATVGLGWALFGSYLLVPEFALAQPGSSHYGLGATTAAVGLIMLPLAIGQTVAAPLAGAVSRRVNPRAVFAAGQAESMRLKPNQ